ncbi:Putative CS domain, SGS domain, HSP20-like chaperone, protein Sgt1 [Septoria linicola]|uniref:CS domain, SGS domain, HSP20-like chaperone, protein Sgt1 n=1 Tax=Septoria linicola TaxID=215465 RepID=A0A9Q9AUL0_9PEZI|nr:putative CS domain, SGS domain, HSP20-like chaperone, protein Sgt1 [Septoria linicola]USW50996.1 Putative CS domain, SGS domain, HSP20-like chaperone, protein Sgt1 [Septoria linicola]
MAAQALRGKKAMEASNYEEAIKEYTSAIQESPTSPDFYIQRSVANQRAGHLDASLADAEQGVLNAVSRAKKELITEAQFRRGVALYKLGRLGDAEYVLTLVKQRDDKHKQADMWINKTKMDLAKVEPQSEKRRVTVNETPSQPAAAVTFTETATVAAMPAAPQQTPADKIRYDWYQNTENIYFTLMAKGVPKDKCVVEITERALNVSFPIGSNSSYDLCLEPLFGAVEPERCITRVLPSKIEIILIKAQAGQKWHKLEGDDPSLVKKADSVAGTDTCNDEAIKRAVFAEPTKGPAYPTSSKKGPKDWDKVAKEAMPTSGKPGAAEEDDDYEGGDEANHFFKKLYKGASPEAQRAMMKSYTESNGTALSTNWEEVSKGPVETSPPDGMEAKSWK